MHPVAAVSHRRQPPPLHCRQPPSHLPALRPAVHPPSPGPTSQYGAGQQGQAGHLLPQGKLSAACQPV
jgi:hypothetical protein